MNNINNKNDSGPQYGRHYVITEVFLEVVEKESIPEVTTNQPSDAESSQSASREGSLFKI